MRTVPSTTEDGAVDLEVIGPGDNRLYELFANDDVRFEKMLDQLRGGRTISTIRNMYRDGDNDVIHEFLLQYYTVPIFRGAAEKKDQDVDKHGDRLRALMKRLSPAALAHYSTYADHAALMAFPETRGQAAAARTGTIKEDLLAEVYAPERGAQKIAASTGADVAEEWGPQTHGPFLPAEGGRRTRRHRRRRSTRKSRKNRKTRRR